MRTITARHKRGQAALALLILVFLIIGAFVAYRGFTGQGLFTIGSIGEEGFTPLDPLLYANDYDRTIWQWIPGTCVNTIYLKDPCPLPQYTGVSANNGVITVNGNFQTEQDPHALRVNNLRLVNLRVTVRMNALSNTNFATGEIRTSKGTVYTELLGGDSVGSGKKVDVSSLELRWNDYELGHYQIFRNQESTPIQEGTVADGENFWIELIPGVQYSPNGESQNVAVGFENPRIKALFGDLQEGEVLTDVCFGGPAVITIDDLTGFKRFDVDAPSTHVTNVAEGNEIQSKQVMYALAQGEGVIIQDNEAWKFAYIADSGTDLIGVSSNCDAPVLIEDLVDLPTREPAIQDKRLEWSTYGRFDGTTYKRLKRDLKSGDQTFMATSDVQINEQLCPYSENRTEYPGGASSACFTIEAFGQAFSDGETKDIGPYLRVKLDDLTVRYQLTSEGKKSYVWDARWRLDFQEDGVLLENVKANGVIQLKSTATAEFDVLNRLPGPGTFTITGKTTHKILSEESFVQVTTTLNAAEKTRRVLALNSNFLGDSQLFIFPTLQTEIGGVSFRPVTIDYTVQEEPPTSAQSANVTQGDGQGFFARLWAWILSLFGG